MLVQLGANVYVNPEHVSAVTVVGGDKGVDVCFLDQRATLRIQIPHGIEPEEFLGTIARKINGENNVQKTKYRIP